VKAKEKFFGLDIPFIDLLQAKAEHWEKGRAVASIEIRPELHNSWQTAHGGVVMALLDVTTGSAARSCVPHAAGVVTVDMSVSFLSAGHGRLVVEGRVLRSGGSIIFCEGEMRDAAGDLVAKAMASFKVKRKVSHGDTAN
jgi:uncharacterized protein (TIGR00369 family)